MTTTAHSTESIVADTFFPALSEFIISSTGLVYYADRPEALAAHVSERLESCGLAGCHDYWRLLQDEQAGEAELDRLIELLTIGETHFFRHRELFDALREIALPEVIHRNRATQRIRAWSAGCSTGAEAYSVSILLRRDLRHLVHEWKISILGTDINRPFLRQAAEGRYDDWAFRGTPAELRRECFAAQAKGWRIDPRFQEGVTFAYHNLARHPFPSLVHNLSAFDLILCRNVLIYFAPAIVQRIFSQLTECLVPGGWLAVGHAEHSPFFFDELESVNCSGATLYRKPATLAVPEKAAPTWHRNHRLNGARPICASDTARQAQAQPPRGARTAGRLETLPAARPATPPECRACPEIEQVRALADQGCVDTALRLCAALIARNRLNPTYYFYQALMLDQAAGPAAAVHALNKAIYLDREFVLAHYYLGRTREKLGQAAGGLKSFANVVRLLADRDPTELVADGEGMTVADLRELANMHLEILDKK